MPYPTKRIQFGDYIFDITDDVYEPADDSFLFAENLGAYENSNILDLGTGCGILGVLVAKKASHVTAIDINPYAISCAKMNSALNNVRDKIDFIRGDLLTSLAGSFQYDLILFNAPYLPSEHGEDSSWIGRSWAGGYDGRQVIDKFITCIPLYLASNGRVLLMQSTLTGVDESIRKFGEQGLPASVKAERKLPFFETLTLIEAKSPH